MIEKMEPGKVYTYLKRIFPEEIHARINSYLRYKQPTSLLEQIDFYHKTYDYMSNILSDSMVDDDIKRQLLQIYVFKYIKSDIKRFIYTHRGLSIRYPEFRRRYKDVEEKFLIYDLLVKNYFKYDYQRIIKFICGYLKDREIVDIIQMIKQEINAYKVFKMNGLL